ncbi:MAG: glycoside hydrolase family 11 protein, partial [Fibrobacter sp.]|nr:glycoside hydrolase family 11 protein [Fibrobacter sp.]
MKKCSLAGIGLAMTLGLAVSAFAADACNDNMGHTGNGSQVSGNRVGSISGTPWGYEQWYQGGNASMTYYSNGTFKANWSGSSDYLTRVGYQYNGNGISHKTKNFAVDYKYTKSGNAQYGYIGVYGWTKNPETEYYIVDDWFSKP